MTDLDRLLAAGDALADAITEVADPSCATAEDWSALRTATETWRALARKVRNAAQEGK